MIETVTKKIAPQHQDDLINTMAFFGWHLADSREVLSENTYLTNEGGKIYENYEKTHYVSVVFQRDTNMKNYSRLAELETEYFNNMDLDYLNPKWGRVVLASLLFAPGIFLLVLFFFALNPASGMNAWICLLGAVPFLVIGGLWLVVAIIKCIGRVKRRTYVIGENKKRHDIRSNILKEAQTLV